MAHSPQSFDHLLLFFGQLRNEVSGMLAFSASFLASGCAEQWKKDTSVFDVHYWVDFTRNYCAERAHFRLVLLVSHRVSCINVRRWQRETILIYYIVWLDMVAVWLCVCVRCLGSFYCIIRSFAHFILTPLRHMRPPHHVGLSYAFSMETLYTLWWWWWINMIAHDYVYKDAVLLPFQDVRCFFRNGKEDRIRYTRIYTASFNLSATKMKSSYTHTTLLWRLGLVIPLHTHPNTLKMRMCFGWWLPFTCLATVGERKKHAGRSGCHTTSSALPVSINKTILVKYKCEGEKRGGYYLSRWHYLCERLVSVCVFWTICVCLRGVADSIWQYSRSRAPVRHQNEMRTPVR